MRKIEVFRGTDSQPLLSGNRVEDLGFFHKTLPESARRELNTVHFNDDKTITASFDKDGYEISLTENSCSLSGRMTEQTASVLMTFAAQKEARRIRVQAQDSDSQLAWLKAQDFLLDVSNVQPKPKTLKKLTDEAEKLAPVGDFFKNAKKLTLHAGSLSTDKKSPGQRFLDVLSKQAGKLALAMKPVQKFYNKNKTVINLGGMGLSFVLMGPIGTTLFSQIDKARRAHAEASRRREGEKKRLEKIAAFAEKGLHKSKSRKMYASRPYVRFAGHLATRLAGTIALTAVAGPIVGATASGLITLGKTIYDTRILQDLILKAVGKKPKNELPINERLHKALQTGIGVEIQKEKVDKILNKILPAAWMKKQKKAGR